MGKLLTANQAAVRMMDMRAVQALPYKHITSHTVRMWIRTGRLQAQRAGDGINWLIDEENLGYLKPPRGGRKPSLPDEKWKAIKHEVIKMGRSPTLVARAYEVDPVTAYRYLKRDGLKPPYKTFVPGKELDSIIREIRSGVPLARVAHQHRYAAVVVSRALKEAGLEPSTARPLEVNRIVETVGDKIRVSTTVNGAVVGTGSGVPQ